MNNDQKYYLARKLLRKGCGSECVKKLYKPQLLNLGEVDPKFIKSLEESDVSLIPFWEEDYPSRLKLIKGYPAILFGRGNMQLLNVPSITIVGTRNISSYGMRIIDFLLKSLDKRIVVVSGLAMGIDVYAHKRSLESNRHTIAVVAGGIDMGYPKSNQGVYEKISEKGLVLAEFPPGKEIVKGMFPMRNRIMAGLSPVTLVVEASEYSGSFITAHYALDYGNEVYTIPGSIFSKESVGCNRLLQMGATPLIKREDIQNLNEYIFDKFKL